MTDSQIYDKKHLVEDAHLILGRELCAIAARSCCIHEAQIPKYVDDNAYLYAEEAARIIERLSCQP